jgi:integrase
MRTRTRGIQLAEDGSRSVDKQYKGQRVFERLGIVSQDEAEAWLRQQQALIDLGRELELRGGDEQLFAAGAAKYLTECEQRKVKSLETIAYHVQLLVPYIGKLKIRDVCNDALEPFKEDRIAEGVSATTVNRTLEVVRTVTNRAARVWRTNGKPWLNTAPLIEMLKENRRPPRPITWAEQTKLLKYLPVHLQRMLVFTVNTGARDDNVCGLLWEWERPVPELGRSVFVIPPEHFKGDRHHVLILNDAAWSVVEQCRGMHKTHVFAWRREREVHVDKAPKMEFAPVETMNNTGFQNAREAAGMVGVRIHDLRHTYGQRLRDAGVVKEDRALLLGHACDDMPEHYASATVARLVGEANKVGQTLDRTTLLRVVNG